MIDVLGTFKQAMREPIKVVKAIIIGEVESYSSSDTLMSFTVESAGYYFRSATKALTFKLLGNDYTRSWVPTAAPPTEQPAGPPAGPAVTWRRRPLSPRWPHAAETKAAI